MSSARSTFSSPRKDVRYSPVGIICGAGFLIACCSLAGLGVLQSMTGQGEQIAPSGGEPRAMYRKRPAAAGGLSNGFSPEIWRESAELSFDHEEMALKRYRLAPSSEVGELLKIRFRAKSKYSAEFFEFQFQETGQPTKVVSISMKGAREMVEHASGARTISQVFDIKPAALQGELQEYVGEIEVLPKGVSVQLNGKPLLFLKEHELGSSDIFIATNIDVARVKMDAQFKTVVNDIEHTGAINNGAESERLAHRGAERARDDLSAPPNAGAAPSSNESS